MLDYASPCKQQLVLHKQQQKPAPGQMNSKTNYTVLSFCIITSDHKLVVVERDKMLLKLE